MKKVHVTESQVGLVLSKGDYKRVLTAGKHRVWFGEQVVMYNLAEHFRPTIDLDILLRDEQLASMLNVIEVKDNEIAMLFEKGKYKYVLNPGRYAYWNTLKEWTCIMCDLSKVDIPKEVTPWLMKQVEVAARIRSYTVESYEKAVLVIDGRIEKDLSPGVYYFWKNETPVQVLKADMRQLQMEISGQEMLTLDKAALRVNFDCQFKVDDLHKALLNSKDYTKQVYTAIQLGLREFIGTLTLDELLEKKHSIADVILDKVRERIAGLGVKLVDGGIRDIILPGDMKSIMNQVLIAQKEAQANTIARREETASTRSLLNTAKLMEDNEMLYKLKEMEYVERIADKINNISLSGGGQLVDQLREIFTRSGS